jgi:hypothetical protein
VLKPASFVETLVLDAVATTARLERSSLGLRTALLDANLDSLTLIAVVTRVEIACGVAFEGDEVVAIIGARDLGEICELILRKIEGGV